MMVSKIRVYCFFLNFHSSPPQLQFFTGAAALLLQVPYWIYVTVSTVYKLQSHFNMLCFSSDVQTCQSFYFNVSRIFRTVLRNQITSIQESYC